MWFKQSVEDLFATWMLPLESDMSLWCTEFPKWELGMPFLPTITTRYAQPRNCPPGKLHISNLCIDISNKGMLKISACPNFIPIIPALAQSQVTHSSLLPICLSPAAIWRTADTRRPITLQYFAPLLNLNDGSTYRLLHPYWVSHYSVCLACLWNGNLRFGPLCIWAPARAACSTGKVQNREGSIPRCLIQK